MIAMKTACPKCGQVLDQAGEVTHEGRTFPVFQCDDCTETVELFGAKVEAAHTFALDGRGRPFNPADSPPDGG